MSGGTFGCVAGGPSVAAAAAAAIAALVPDPGHCQHLSGPSPHQLLPLLLPPSQGPGTLEEVTSGVSFPSPLGSLWPSVGAARSSMAGCLYLDEEKRTD